MTDSSMHRSSTDENGPEQESLTQIEGIGKAKKQWLEAIGIKTLQALADATLEEAATQLSAQGRPVSFKELEGWIIQAQDLITELKASEPEPKIAETKSPITEIEPTSSASAVAPERAETTSEATEATEATARSKEVDQASTTETTSAPDKSTENWQAFAAFEVEFQSQQNAGEINYRTLVRHLATDQEETWSGIEENDLQSWLRSQVSEVISSDPSAAAKTTSSPKTWITLDIEDLFVLQPPSTVTAMALYKPNMIFPNPIEGNIPFALALQFGVQEQDILANAKQSVLYKVEGYIRRLKGKESIALEEIPPTRLRPQSGSYTVCLPAISLQQGIYRLQVFLSLEGMQALPAVIEVPAFQVI